MGIDNLVPTGIQTPDNPAHSDFLYRLHHPLTNNQHVYEETK
jgi:hypothetical protein